MNYGNSAKLLPTSQLTRQINKPLLHLVFPFPVLLFSRGELLTLFQ